MRKPKTQRLPRTRHAALNLNGGALAGGGCNSIVGAARVLFANQGYAGTTSDAIAEAAGVAVQTVHAVIGSGVIRNSQTRAQFISGRRFLRLEARHPRRSVTPGIVVARRTHAS
jgi:hypothetical protein